MLCAAATKPPGEAGAAAPAADAAALPQMPPGWKPGDAVPDLPAHPPVLQAQAATLRNPAVAAAAPSWDAVTAAPAAAGRAESAPPRPAAPPPAPNSAFDFILNPDLEEVEEAYSSDEEYSDDA